MRDFKPNIVREKIGEPVAGGEPTPPATDPKQVPAPNPPPAEGAGSDDDFDDLGYKKTKGEGDPSKGGDNPPDKEKSEPGKEEPVKEPATGYGAEPLKEEPADPPVPPKEEPKGEPDEVDKALEGVHKDDLASIKAMAKELGLSAEQAKKLGVSAIADRKRVEDFRKDQEKEALKKLKVRNAGWDKELREDKDFGGEKFAKNVQMAERLMQDYGPEFKKQLTESKGMLPPNVMRMLARAADVMYRTDKMVHGDPAKPNAGEKPKDPTDEALEFYKS